MSEELTAPIKAIAKRKGVELNPAHRIPERSIKPIQERYINMSNALSRSAHGLCLGEKRIIALALAKTDSKRFEDLQAAQMGGGFSVKLSTTEYAESFAVDSDTAYTQLAEAGKNLMKRQVKTRAETRKGLKEVLTNWCGQSIYNDGEGTIEITFTPQISPYLLGLKGAFASYRLKQVSGLRSVYSWRLFECLQSWEKTGKWSPTIEEFHLAMDTTRSCQSNFGQLNLRVIAPALKELREKDGMDIDFEPIKAGRKVIGLTFTFEKRKEKKGGKKPA